MANLSARLADNRRAVLFAGVALVAAVLGVGAPKLLFGGGEDPYANLADITATAAPPAGSTSNTLGSGAPVPASGDPAVPAGGVDTHDHAGGFETATMRDPFCPLVAAGPAGTPPVTCAEQAPATPGAPMALMDVFADGGHDHARVRVGPKVFTLHAGDTFEEYTVVSLAEPCGEFSRGPDQRQVCEGEEWGGTAPAKGA